MEYIHASNELYKMILSIIYDIQQKYFKHLLAYVLQIRFKQEKDIFESITRVHTSNSLL